MVCKSLSLWQIFRVKHGLWYFQQVLTFKTNKKTLTLGPISFQKSFLVYIYNYLIPNSGFILKAVEKNCVIAKIYKIPCFPSIHEMQLFHLTLKELSSVVAFLLLISDTGGCLLLIIQLKTIWRDKGILINCVKRSVEKTITVREITREIGELGHVLWLQET